jgi:hypothetical protein
MILTKDNTDEVLDYVRTKTIGAIKNEYGEVISWIEGRETGIRIKVGDNVEDKLNNKGE